MFIREKEQNSQSPQLKIHKAQDTLKITQNVKNQGKNTFSREKEFIQSEPKMNYMLKFSDKDFKVIL